MPAAVQVSTVRHGPAQGCLAAGRASLVAAEPPPPAATRGRLCRWPLIGQQRGHPAAFLGSPDDLTRISERLDRLAASAAR